MDVLLEKAILRCFPDDELIQKNVRREFLKSKDQCEAFLAIKSRMYEELMKDDTDLYSQYLFKLIFEEHIGILDDVIDDESIWRGSISDHQHIELDETDPRKVQFYRMRSDEAMMFALLNQEIPRFYKGMIRIIVTRWSLQISINGLFVTDIAHKNGFEYDTESVEKFAKMIMSKYPLWVTIEMNGEGLSPDLINLRYMGNYVNRSIIDELPRVIPAEGLEQYISEERPVYFKYVDGLANRKNYQVLFKCHTAYFAGHMDQFWGYIREED